MRFGAALWVERTTWRSADDGSRFGSAEQTELDGQVCTATPASIAITRSVVAAYRELVVLHAWSADEYQSWLAGAFDALAPGPATSDADGRAR